jgi:hypothetical protein
MILSKVSIGVSIRRPALTDNILRSATHRLIVGLLRPKTFGLHWPSLHRMFDRQRYPNLADIVSQ